MTPLELKVARKLLGLSTVEAAEHIGKVSKRSWEYWENGQRTIKPDVEELINSLLARRREIIVEVYNMGEKAKGISVIYYNTPEHCESVLEWRFSQSLASTLSLDFGARLVEFDKKDFEIFINENMLLDSKPSRAMWAASR